jgi:glucokinase
MDTKNYICIDIGGTKILATLFENDRVIFNLKKKTKAYEGVEKLRQKLIDLVGEMLIEANMTIDDITAISAGAAGIIDDKGVIIYSPNLPWTNFDIKTFMEEHYKVPFYIGNDVNMGILGEWKYGAGIGKENLLGIFVGTGIGGGIIVNGNLYTGNKYAAGEFGHTTLNTEGPYCNCGQRGCLEAYSSKVAMLREIENEISRGGETILKDFFNGNYNTLKSKFLKKGLEDNDEFTIDLIDKSMYYLAAGAGNFINIFDPQMLILGGGVIEALGNYAINRFKKYLKKFTMVNIINNVEIRSAKLDDLAVVFGARALIEMNK